MSAQNKFMLYTRAGRAVHMDVFFEEKTVLRLRALSKKYAWDVPTLLG